MSRRWRFETPDELFKAQGPARALEEAVALLAPFDHRPLKYPGLDWEPEADPPTVALALVMQLAEDLNARAYRALNSPRVGEMLSNFDALRDLLKTVAIKVRNLDDLSRLHLQSQASLRHLNLELLPSVSDDRDGEFVRMARQFADLIDDTTATLRTVYGGKDIADKGGRQAHYERYLGGAKTLFVKEAFDLFESYHPGVASSSEGGPFHRFVHLVYEHATAEHDEDVAAISHLLRSLITPLKKLRAIEPKYRQLRQRIADADPKTATYRKLVDQAKILERKRSELDAQFTPLMKRLRGQPPAKKGK